MPAEDLKDISNIPYFAYEPGMYLWIFLVSAAALIFILFKWILKHKKRHPDFKAFDKALSELQKIKNSLDINSNFRSRLFDASITVRRFISYTEQQDYSSLTEQELKEKNSSANERLKILLNAVIEIEKYKYKPQLSFDETSALVMSLIKSVADYKARQVTA